ncbi:MAG: exonuclease SbcCD subunit D, partial [Tepidiformaceae bacterium]
MKLLHTSDWHLGRMTYNHSRADDHDAVLNEIVQLAREQRPDLVLHTGDLFDVPRPAYADIERGLNALQEFAALAPVVVVCGNHDSPALFRIFGRLLGSRSAIRFIDRPRHPNDGGVLEYPSAAGERIRLAPLPFIHANRLVDAFDSPDTWNADYADRVQGYEDILAKGLLDGSDPATDILLFAAHLHVGGASFSGTERQVTVSDAYATRSERLPVVSYAAFGHIHKPQRLPGPVPGRYAGSPIQLDFGEEGEQKQVVLVEAAPGRPADIVEKPLKSGRALRRVTGTVEEIRLQAPSIGNALCLLTVRTPNPVPDLSRQMRDLLPEATVLDVFEVSDRPSVVVVTRDAVGGRPEQTIPELFAEYLDGLAISGS